MYISRLYSQSVLKPPLLMHYEVDNQMEKINVKIINIETSKIERKFHSLGTYCMEGRLTVPVGVFFDERI